MYGHDGCNGHRKSGRVSGLEICEVRDTQLECGYYSRRVSKSQREMPEEEITNGVPLWMMIWSRV